MFATNFPTSIDAPLNPAATDKVNNTVNGLKHSVQHDNINDAMVALETKVGVNGSAVTTSHDYKLSGVTGSDKAVSKTGIETLTNKTLTNPVSNGTDTGTQTLSNKTLTSPVVNVGSDATGDIYYRNSGGVLTRLPIGSSNKLLQVIAGVPSWQTIASAAPTVITATGTTLAMTTTAGQIVVVMAKGTILYNSASDNTLRLKYNGVDKDTVDENNGSSSSNSKFPFTMMYTETPGAGTQNITVTADAGTLSKVVIIAVIYG